MIWCVDSYSSISALLSPVFFKTTTQSNWPKNIWPRDELSTDRDKFGVRVQLSKRPARCCGGSRRPQTQPGRPQVGSLGSTSGGGGVRGGLADGSPRAPDGQSATPPTDRDGIPVLGWGRGPAPPLDVTTWRRQPPKDKQRGSSAQELDASLSGCVWTNVDMN